MDAVPVYCADAKGAFNAALGDAVYAAGGQLTTEPEAAVYLVYAEEDLTLNDLMATVPAQLNSDLEAVKNNRIALLDLSAYTPATAENYVQLVEDIAEILHPGAFIFGYEGARWVRFGA